MKIPPPGSSLEGGIFLSSLLSSPKLQKISKNCTFDGGATGEKRKKKNPETVATQRFQGFSLLARPKGLEPPTFRTGSSKM